jgi:four helix bundle protein
MRPIAKSFRNLDVYRTGREAALNIFQLFKSFPTEERFLLTDQIRRSSRAVNAMLGAAWASRRYRAAFTSKLDEALEETMETQRWLDHALDGKYISAMEFTERDGAWQSIGAMLNSMMNKQDTFCKFAPGADHRLVCESTIHHSPFTIY